jgi:predicted DNA-binding protein
MSLMDTTTQKNNGFMNLYNKSYRLSAAVFAISNVMDENEEIRDRIKKLSLEIVSMSVRLKDANFYDTKKQIGEIEKKSLELMSMLDISAIAGMISKMNAKIIKEEFESFIKELNNFSLGLNSNNNIKVEDILKNTANSQNRTTDVFEPNDTLRIAQTTPDHNSLNGVVNKNNSNGISSNGHKRKETRKINILNFIKSHNNITIKDIVPHIIGCSEKTVQRELINLINEGKIKKNGERRWTRYSVI